MREIIAWILVGLLLFFGGLMTYESISHNSKANTAIKERHDSSMLYIALRHSLDHMIVIHAKDSSMYDSVISHKSKPVYYVLYDTLRIPDTTHPKLCESIYTDSVKSDRFSFKYDAFIADCYLKQIRIHHIIYPVDTVKTPTIFKDTCKPQPKISPWGLDITPRIAYNIFDNSFSLLGEGELSYRNIKGILELGLTTKKQIEANIGVGYTFPIK
jgi:hypothetical protein